MFLGIIAALASTAGALAAPAVRTPAARTPSPSRPSAPAPTPTPAAPALPSNIVVNASFELPAWFNGTPMRQFVSNDEAYITVFQGKTWTPLPDAEGWLADGPDAAGVTVTTTQAHSGQRSLQVIAADTHPRSVISDYHHAVPAGPVTLTAWVKTRHAHAHLDLDLVSDWKQVSQRGAQVHGTIPLPSDHGWTRLELTVTSPGNVQALCRLAVDRGTVYMDDVQITPGLVPVPFNVRPEEWLRLEFPDQDDTLLTRWVANDRSPRRLLVFNDSRLPLQGEVSLFQGPWYNPGHRTLEHFDVSGFPPGAVREFPFETSGAPPDAYVLSLLLANGGTAVIDGPKQFFPDSRTGGAISNGMMASRTAIRYVVGPDTPPAQLFGVGNSMLHTGGDWYAGYSIDDFKAARPLGLTCSRAHYSEDMAYITAAAGIPMEVMYIDDTFGPLGRIDELTKKDDHVAANPLNDSMLDIFNPAGWSMLQKRAALVGQRFAHDPEAAAYQMSNEAPFFNTDALCPSPFADADFRDWCRRQFRSLVDLNAHWGTSYNTWKEVEQPVSAGVVESVRSRAPKDHTGDPAAPYGVLNSAEVKKLIAENSARAMDWMRWRTDASLRMFTTFHDIARQYDTKTLYGNNLCWPAFTPQIAMPLSRAMDATLLDIQYTAGQPRSLGTPAEMMDSLELSEGAAPDKPIWGIETYYQPEWPAEYLALQNWGLLAHGMNNNLVFAWKPFADAGPVKSPRAWEKPDAPAMWFLIDSDGTHLPGYDVYVRSLEEIRRYHTQFDGFSVKRAPADTAFYVSRDTNEYIQMETGGQPWTSFWQHTRNNLAYLLRLQGVQFDDVDDTTLPDAPGKYQRIVVPASYVLSQDAAGRLARFAQAGGTVVLAGVTGVCDPWLRPYDVIGGPAWNDLAWKPGAISTDPTGVAYSEGDADTRLFRGSGLQPLPDGQPIKDTAGDTIGWSRSWGRGTLIACTVFPDTYVTDPHPASVLDAWAEHLVDLAHLPVAARWINRDPAVTPGKPGEGSPVVEVVVRQKSPNEKFLFCLNQGGAGDGVVETPAEGGPWQAEDAITGQPITTGHEVGNLWRLPLRLAAYGYRIIHLSRPAADVKG